MIRVTLLTLTALFFMMTTPVMAGPSCCPSKKVMKQEVKAAPKKAHCATKDVAKKDCKTKKEACHVKKECTTKSGELKKECTTKSGELKKECTTKSSEAKKECKTKAGHAKKACKGDYTVAKVQK